MSASVRSEKFVNRISQNPVDGNSSNSS